MRNRLKNSPSGCLLVSAVSLILITPDLIESGKAAAEFNPPLYLVYDVTYAGGKIAEIDLSESKPYSYNGQEVRELECRVESSGLLDINGLYRSIVADDCSLVYFKSDEGLPGDRRVVEYNFDYNNRSCVMIDRQIKGADTISATSTIRNINKKYFDTVSMIFKIRNGIDTLCAPVFMPVFIGGKQDSILIESVQDVQSTDQNGRQVDAFLVKIRLPFPPYPGFGDSIEIHISKDGGRIPLRGRMEMALGYLEIKLRPE